MPRNDLQAITWLGNSRENITGFGKPIREQIGSELYRLQIGLDPENWKPMNSIGTGVREIRVSIDGQFRVIYVIRRPEGIVVLHAFQKKSAQTRRVDIETARRRLRQHWQ